MHVRFWGTRGSIAKAGATTLRFGGNTSCVEVRTDAGTLIVIDCGTGAHGLGEDLARRAAGAPITGHILISHTHWDHIQGLPFLAPLFQPGNSWHVYGPRGLGASLNKTLAGQMEYAYFPVSLEQLAGVVEYHDLVEGTFEIGEVQITTEYLNHPALTLGYRISADGATLVYASDHEPHSRSLAAGGDFTTSSADRTHAAFLDGADLLIHDAQFLAAEYETREGWGHSTVEYVVAAAHAAHVERVALYHHDPGRSDDAVDALVEQAREQGRAAGFGGEIFAAAEGMELELRGRPGRTSTANRKPATMQPALADLPRTVLIVAGRREIEAGFEEAAVAEGLTVWTASNPADALSVIREREPSLIVAEAGDGVRELVGAVRGLGTAYGAEVCIVTVADEGTGSPADDGLSNEHLGWPASPSYLRTKLHAWMLRCACRWQPAALPRDEDRRQGALERLGILDTAPEPRFDHLTELARKELDTPIALVSLIDRGRQWFKSRLGLDAQETPREMAFCAHAILADGVFQVPDSLEDPRFADNPLVTGDPHVRFYAGVPLTLRDGSRVGTLCVIDHRPRQLTEAQLAELSRLAELVTEQLEGA